jgi:hypothetical protein
MKEIVEFLQQRAVVLQCTPPVAVSKLPWQLKQFWCTCKFFGWTTSHHDSMLLICAYSEAQNISKKVAHWEHLHTAHSLWPNQSSSLRGYHGSFWHLLHYKKYFRPFQHGYNRLGDRILVYNYSWGTWSTVYENARFDCIQQIL